MSQKPGFLPQFSESFMGMSHIDMIALRAGAAGLRF